MDESAARDWLVQRIVSRETLDKLEILTALVRQAAERQNLVARSTLPHFLQRHIVESAQLVELVGRAELSWADIGTGAGFPGLVVAILWPGTVTCIEPRGLRAAFLREAVARLDLSKRVTIIPRKAEHIQNITPFAIVSARAVARLSTLFRAGQGLASPETIWLLPKGRSADAELAEARGSWQGEFRLVPSITDPAASIVVARYVRPRTGR